MKGGGLSLLCIIAASSLPHPVVALFSIFSCSPRVAARTTRPPCPAIAFSRDLGVLERMCPKFYSETLEGER